MIPFLIGRKFARNLAANDSACFIGTPTSGGVGCRVKRRGARINSAMSAPPLRWEPKRKRKVSRLTKPRKPNALFCTRAHGPSNVPLRPRLSSPKPSIPFRRLPRLLSRFRRRSQSTSSFSSLPFPSLLLLWPRNPRRRRRWHSRRKCSSVRGAWAVAHR